ncbi:MAG TPA: hypothetical protein VHT05_04020 [Candidatus Elarobacter sp.]|jgi:plasmid maintenance system antidote protein VapI|nr:hypothetical protein [Candidatus Elarobacter sp.]
MEPAKTPATSERPARVRIDPSDLALEIVSIVIAIVLATGVGQLVDHVRAQARTQQALVELRREIATDDAELRRVSGLHRRVWLAFQRAVSTAHDRQMTFDTFTRTFGTAASHGYEPFDGTTTAWDLTRNSNVLEEVPYELRARLQTRYGELAGLRDVEARLISNLEFAPSDARPNFYFAAYAVVLNLADAVAAEERLVDDDRSALDALARAGIT